MPYIPHESYNSNHNKQAIAKEELVSHALDGSYYGTNSVNTGL